MKQDIMKYNTRNSLLATNPSQAIKILGLGMTLHTFQTLIGNFDDKISLQKNIKGAGVLGSLVSVREIESKPLYSNEKKKDNLYFNPHAMMQSDIMMSDVLEQRASFYGMVAHSLQTIRLRYPSVEFTGNYDNPNNFEVTMMFPQNKKNGTLNYYEVPIEFINGDNAMTENEGIKIFCYDHKQLTKELVTKIDVITETRSNVIFAFYDEYNRNLPLYCTQKGNFQGESFYFSSLFTRIIQGIVRNKQPLDAQKAYELLANVVDKSQRFFTVNEQDEENQSLIKVNLDFALADYIKMSIYFNIVSDLSTEEYMLISKALSKHSMSDLQIADMTVSNKDNVQGVFSYLIYKANDIINSKTIEQTLKFERENQQQVNDGERQIEDEEFVDDGDVQSNTTDEENVDDETNFKNVDNEVIDNNDNNKQEDDVSLDETENNSADENSKEDDVNAVKNDETVEDNTSNEEKEERNYFDNF